MKPKIQNIFVLFLTAACCLLAGCRKDDDSMKLYTEVRSVNKLVLAQMTVTQMAAVDDISLEDAKGMKQTIAAMADALKIGSRKAAYSYSTYLRAYMDMSEFQPSDITIDNRHKTIILNLPDVKTEFAGRDMEIKEEHYRVSGLRSEINASERAALKEKMNTQLKEKVRENPEFKEKLESQARAKAKDYFSSLLEKEGYRVTVNFKQPLL